MDKTYPHDYALRAYQNATACFEQSLEYRANHYIKTHPNVWESFQRHAWELIMAGHSRIGAKAIAERIRWEGMIQRADKDAYLVNNSYITFMAEKFVSENPQLEGVFERRKRK